MQTSTLPGVFSSVRTILVADTDEDIAQLRPWQWRLARADIDARGSAQRTRSWRAHLQHHLRVQSQL